MPTLADLAKDLPSADGSPQSAPTTTQEKKPEIPSILRFLKVKSPDTPLESYKNHPLNFLKSEGLGQVIRGFEGLFGELKYAIVDIVIGGIRLFFEKRHENLNNRSDFNN